jgi:hypothetical protein
MIAAADVPADVTRPYVSPLRGATQHAPSAQIEAEERSLANYRHSTGRVERHKIATRKHR